MSKPQYIYDEVITVCLQGIRTVNRIDSSAAHGDDRYYLSLEYKGLSKRVEYKDKISRDNMYTAIAKVIAVPATKLLHGECAT